MAEGKSDCFGTDTEFLNIQRHNFSGTNRIRSAETLQSLKSSGRPSLQSNLG